MAFEFDTQDIRDATQSSEEGKLFFLLIATPKCPPKQFHKKVVQPYLYQRGWKKISYKQTGFRALYFFHDSCNSDDVDSNSLLSISNQKCLRCLELNDDDAEIKPPVSKLKKTSSSKHSFNSLDIPNSCDECSTWTPMQRASHDRNGLKKVVDDYKNKLGGSFEVHIILSKPVNDEEEFLQIASQPGATD